MSRLRLFVSLGPLFFLPSAFSAELCMSLHEAAHAALDEAIELSTDYEHGGVLYKVDGCHFYSEPTTSKEEKRLKIRAYYPKGAEVAGIYHTHTANTFGVGRFSGVDVKMYHQVGVPSFMGETYSGRKYELVIERFRYAYLRTGVRGTLMEPVEPLLAASVATH